MDRTSAAFRRDLIHRVAATEAVQRLNRHTAPPDLAKQLGVQDEVLQLAIRIAGAGAGAPALVELHVFIPWPIATPLFTLARSLGTTPGPLIRSLMHAVMLTTREPHRRSTGHGLVTGWPPLPGREDARAALARRCTQQSTRIARREKGKQENYHTAVEITVGLERALQRRAVVYGVTRHHYTVLWLADLVDGVLSGLAVPLVRARELHADESQYVLPLVELPAGLEVERDGEQGRGGTDADVGADAADGQDRGADDAGDRDGDHGAGTGSAA